MGRAATFIRVLLREGRAVLRDSPPTGLAPDADLAQVLRGAYADYCLDIAGPVPAFDEATALAAAAVVEHACWALVSHTLPVDEIDKQLKMPGSPQTPAQHLSADLLLRFLAQVHRRARARDPVDPLPALLEKVLRQWPLSGVLADIDEGPMAPLDFGGHAGLMLLYAERLASREKPAWFPTGKLLEYLELVRTN